MGIAIFLLICFVVVLIGLCIKYGSEQNIKTTEVKTEEVKESSDTGTIVINSNRPFPKTNITSNNYTKYYIQSILKLLLDIQSNPTHYIYGFDLYRENIYVRKLGFYPENDIDFDDIPVEVLTLLKLKNLISIQQTFVQTKYDNYGFIETSLNYTIIIKVTEEGKTYLNN